MEISVGSFLSRGLLPDNLPPFLTSEQLVAPSLGSETEWHVSTNILGRPSPFSGSKRGFQRRVFSVPHPVFVRDAALFFRRNAQFLIKHFDRTNSSASTPQFEKRGPRAIRITPHSKLPLLRLRTLARYKYCLVTDVSRCFPSIYTHSIPWALHGKKKSKKDRKASSASVFGNRLDYIFRQAQDGQTSGVPVGPDTSRVTAEIVLAAVDQDFEEITGAEYVRHVDDYWIGADSAEECDELLQALRSTLNDYSLDINEQKTRIVRTSAVVSEVWPYDLETQLEQAIGLAEDVRHEGRIVSLLGSLIEYSTKSQDDGVIKFFLRRLDDWQAWDDHWDILEPFLAHCAVQFPHSFDYVARVVAWRIRLDEELDNSLWLKVVRNVIRLASSMGRDTEVLWGLWLAKELNMRMTQKTYNAILNNNSPLVIATLAHYMTKGNANFSPDLKELWQVVDDEPLAGPQWPLSLELNHLGIAKPRKIDLKGPEELAGIHTVKASLVNWDALPRAFLDDDNELNEKPEFAFERRVSSYDDDDDELDNDTPF